MILEVENITKLYKNGRGVTDVSFTLEPGQVLGLLGPNGSGKTTTMKIIAGLIRPQAGEVSICGVDALTRREAAMRHVGCLIEAPALYEHMTAEENLRLAARFYKNIDKARIDEVLRLVEMEKYKKDKTSAFSLGMKQRTGIASALLSNPELLILDEPANGLDIEGMIYVRDVVKKSAENGGAVLISSHLANEIQQCATHAALMYDGQILGLEKMDDILKSFVSLEDYFLSEVNAYRKRTGGESA